MSHIVEKIDFEKGQVEVSEDKEYFDFLEYPEIGVPEWVDMSSTLVPVNDAELFLDLIKTVPVEEIKKRRVKYWWERRWEEGYNCAVRDIKKLSLASLTRQKRKLNNKTMNNKAEQIIQSITEQLKTLSEVIRKDTPREGRITIIDERDGNQYSFIKIGDLWWCTENLRYLPEVSQDTSKDEPRYYVYGYEGNDVDEAKGTEEYKKYGVLYNWEGAKQACPTGTRLPTDEEWQELVDYYGGEDVAGDALKTKEFNALMGGYRETDGTFNYKENYAYFWSSSEVSVGSANAWSRHLYYSHATVYRYSLNKRHGFSVRCVMDIK